MLSETQTQQDVILDEMVQSLERIQITNLEITSELNSQDKDLTELDNEIDEGQSSIQRNLRKLQNTLKQKSYTKGIIGGGSLILLGIVTYLIVKPK